MRKLISFALIYIGWPLASILAQSPGDEFKEMYGKYMEDPYVYTLKKEHIEIELDDGDFDIVSTMYEERMLLDETRRFRGDESVSYTGFDPVESIEAYSLHPRSNHYKKDKVKKFTKKDELDDRVFYNDIKSLNFTFPSVAKGGKTFMSVERNINEPRFLGGFYFVAEVPIDRASFSVTFPESVMLKYECFNCDLIDLTFNETRSRKKVTYTWSASGIPKIKYVDMAPNPRYYIPHILVYIAKYDNKGKQETLLEHPSDLYRWYVDLTKEVNADHDESLQPLVDSLVRNTSSDIEKVRNIYYWVQEHVKYIAIEAGLGGFVPREADLVYKRRYGDCKDMSSLLFQMLRQAGLKGYLTWIGTRDIPYSLQVLPTPSVDNHMIATYIDTEGQYHYLDATGQRLSLDLPAPHIQGKEVLIGKGPNEYEIREVPTIPAEKNRIADTVFIRIKDGDVIGEGRAHIEGYNGYYLSRRVREKNEEDTKNIMSSYLQKGNNKFELDEISVFGTEERDDPITINYDFNIKGYATHYKKDIYLNMFLEKPLYNSSIKKGRKVPVESNYHQLLHNVVILELEEGYGITHMPENKSYQHDLFSFEFTYQQVENKLILDQRVKESYLLLTPEHFDAYNEMIDEINSAYNEAITLTKQ